MSGRDGSLFSNIGYKKNLLSLINKTLHKDLETNPISKLKVSVLKCTILHTQKIFSSGLCLDECRSTSHKWPSMFYTIPQVYSRVWGSPFNKKVGISYLILLERVIERSVLWFCFAILIPHRPFLYVCLMCLTFIVLAPQDVRPPFR